MRSDQFSIRADEFAICLPGKEQLRKTGDGKWVTDSEKYRCRQSEPNRNEIFSFASRPAYGA